MLQNPVSNITLASPVNIAPSYDHYMRRALDLAKEAANQGEVPIGALVVFENQIIAEAFNLKESSCDATAHAEILVLRKASEKLNRWRLTGATLISTLEPCPMCAAAAVQSRIERIVYGAQDLKGGGVRSLYTLAEDSRLNHQIEVHTGVLAEECGKILSAFFQKKREKNK